MGAPRRGKKAPEAEQVAVVKVEVPVLVGTTGHAWALPACRALAGAGLVPGSLIEAPALDAASAEVAAQAAREVALTRGPGRHDVALSVTADPAPAATPDDESTGEPLGGWALAEELLGVDLAQLGSGEPPAPSGHAIEARVFAADAPEGRRCSTCVRRRGRASGSSNAPRWATPSDRASSCASSPTAMTVPPRLSRLRHALNDCAVVVANAATNRPALLAAVAAEIADGAARPRPESDPVAVLVSAVRASDSQRETQRAAFHARAARGRPEPVDASGVSTSLQLRRAAVRPHGVPDRARTPTGSIPGTPWPRSRSTGPTTSSGPSRPPAARATSSSRRTGPAACWRSTASPTGSTATRASPCSRSGRRSSSPSPSARARTWPRATPSSWSRR